MSTDRSRAFARALSRKGDAEPGYEPLAFTRLPQPDRPGRAKVRVETLDDGALLAAVADGQRVAEAKRIRTTFLETTLDRFVITLMDGRVMCETRDWAAARHMVAWAGAYHLRRVAKGLE